MRTNPKYCGLIVWGTKIGFKGNFFSSNTERTTINADTEAFFDIRDVVAPFDRPTLRQVFFGFKQLHDGPCFTIYRAVVDATNRYGFYAISILLPPAKRLSKGSIIALLNELSDQYWNNYVLSGKINDGIQENVDLFDRILRKSEYELLDYVSDERYNTGAEKTIAISYKNEAELDVFFNNYNRFKIAPTGLIYFLADSRPGQIELEFQSGVIIPMPEIEPLRRMFDFVVQVSDEKGNLLRNVKVRATKNGQNEELIYNEREGNVIKQIMFDDSLRIEISKEGYQTKNFGEDIIQQYLNSHPEQVREGKVTFDYNLVPIDDNSTINNNPTLNGGRDNNHASSEFFLSPPVNDSSSSGKINLEVLKNTRGGLKRLKRFRIFQETGGDKRIREAITVKEKSDDVFFISTKDLAGDYRGITVKKIGYKTVGKSRADMERHLKEAKNSPKLLQIVLQPDWLFIITLVVTVLILLLGAVIFIFHESNNSDNYQSLNKAAGNAIEKMRRDIRTDTLAARQDRETAWQKIYELQQIQHIRGMITIRDSLQNLSLDLSKSHNVEKELNKLKVVLIMINDTLSANGTNKAVVGLADSLHKLDSVLLEKTRLKDSGPSGLDTQAINPPPQPPPSNAVPKDLEQKTNSFFSSKDYSALNTGGALTLKKELTNYTLRGKDQHNLSLLNNFITLSRYIANCNKQVAAQEPDNKKVNALIAEKDKMRGLCRSDAQYKAFDNVERLLTNKLK